MCVQIYLIHPLNNLMTLVTIVSPSLLVRKPGHRGAKDLAHGHYLADYRMGIGTQSCLIPKPKVIASLFYKLFFIFLSHCGPYHCALFLTRTL